MIINGGARAGGKALAAHLANREKNERVEVLDVRGCLSTDLRGALVEMEESAEATRCLKPLYHANIDPDRKVRMTPQQWERAIGALEEKLELQDHARAVVMHQKHGREHIHVVWNRIDLETMRTVRDSHNYRKHEQVARELEREFGHDRVQGAHIERDGQPRPDRTAPKWAMQQGERLASDPRQVKEQVRQLWEASDSGRSFTAALEDHGFALAKGDRRDFVVIDRAGGVHSLGRCTGSKAAELRERMADVHHEPLPTLKQAIETVRARPAAERATLAPEPTKAARQQEQNLDETAVTIRLAYRQSANARGFMDALADRGIHLAVATAKEAEHSDLEHLAAKRQGRDVLVYQKGEVVAVDALGKVTALDRHSTGADPAEVQKFLSTLDRKELQGIEATQEQLALRAQQFIALTRVGLLDRPQPQKPARVVGQEKRDLNRYISDREDRRQNRAQEPGSPKTDPERGRGDLER